MLDLNNAPPQGEVLWSTERVSPQPQWQRPSPPPEDEVLIQSEPGEAEPDADDAAEPEAEAEPSTAPEPAEPENKSRRATGRGHRRVKRADLGSHIVDVALRIFGSPNDPLSSQDQIRFGTNGSIAVERGGAKAGTYYNHEHRRGGGVMQLLAFEAGLIASQAAEWLRNNLSIEIESESRGNRFADRIDATYDYHAEDGTLAFQVVRLKDPKDFRQRAPDGRGGWTWKVKGVSPIPFMLQELLAALGDAIVYVAEGEKDVLNMRARGLTATCNAGGAGKWGREFARYFTNRNVVILADNDEAGRAHAKQVAANLAPVARSVRIVALPGLPEKGDVSDWLAAGGTKERLETLVAAAPLFDPQHDAAKAGIRNSPEDPFLINPKNPFLNARQFLVRDYTVGGHHTLRRHRSSFYLWIDGAYRVVTDAGVRTKLYEYLDNCWVFREGELEPVLPDSTMVNKHEDALRAAAHLDDDIEAPAWLGDEPANMPADQMLSLRNGLLHLPTKLPVGHSPAFFTYNVLPFDFDPNPPKPEKWLEFLSQLWPDDPASIATLQEFFGLCLTDITKFQKALMILGPRRCGKGTIARILRALLGRLNVSGPTLNQLSGEFGLQPIIGKRVAIISDARIGPKTDIMALAERLLTITGEDAIDVNRKNLPHWHGQLRVRFIIISNETPRFADASGALAGRFIVLRIVPSFYGKEDLGLTDTLLTELPGILLWSVAGYDRLLKNGRFEQPDSAADDVETMEDIGSPVAAFLRDRCEVGPGFAAPVDDVYKSWVGWCEEHGRQQPGTKEVFGRDLKTVLSTLKVSRPRDGEGDRFRQYKGIKLKFISPGSPTDFNDAPEQPHWTR